MFLRISGTRTYIILDHGSSLVSQLTTFYHKHQVLHTIIMYKFKLHLLFHWYLVIPAISFNSRDHSTIILPKHRIISVSVLLVIRGLKFGHI